MNSQPSATLSRRFSIAPMLDWSDRHCRVFWRGLTQEALLYTEMVTTGALLHAEPARFLTFSEVEHPIALQLGGSDPEALAQCSRLAEEFGYDEVNLNCGCPSDRVQNGMFGACLMAQPQRVADCVKAMQDATSLPVTVKHRIGIDEMESYEEMINFVRPIAETGCQTFIVHARKAWLQGLSPKENREIPPLHYDYVYRLKQDFPELEIIINGGIQTLEECEEHLQNVDGVMVGRAAYHTPLMLNEVDQRLYGSNAPVVDGVTALQRFFPYVEEQLSAGTPLQHMSRHVLGLFQGIPGARQFRRYISENAHKKGAGIEVLEQALACVTEK